MPVKTPFLNRHNGFTLIELIVVIILLAIIGVVATSRYIGLSSVSAYAAQEQVIATIRYVQLARMQSNSDATEARHQLRINSTGDCLGSLAGCNLIDTASSVSEKADIAATRSDINYFEEDVLFTPTDKTYTFDLLGNPSVTETITVRDSTGGSSCEVLINSQGYVSEGNCS
ncbi:prepilin-type N-terminal cleavage/methylation domain-containing protein [Vibrio splendidus]|uniref:prepilin-type N-terminal cleavage/methylation domain-containing protein n=1 Tax=Vibrio splendidus TaxID=29497 RepID=UPI000D359E4B|nr:prepilin-type N-terminal cleavage/methylation domain-containing protein [Vibrio splendidus]PTO62570.1 MSHA biogenesis protein MshC [Vibrio splendidus]